VYFIVRLLQRQDVIPDSNESPAILLGTADRWLSGREMPAAPKNRFIIPFWFDLV
jgi:hypothetical protein